MCQSQYVTTALLDALQPEWGQLWATAVDEAERVGADPRYVFDPIGLLLQPPDEPLRFSYEATPADALTFASTGGDGVHFSACEGTQGPIVVMTVPMQFSRPNVVVGQHLREFLSLGCRYGYFALEQLAYDYSATANSLDRGLTPGDDQAEQQLALLRRRLQLEPWPAVLARLNELQLQLGPQ
jgi:hypothetical protein